VSPCFFKLEPNYFLGLDQTNNQMVNLNTIYTDRSISLNVPQLNVPNSSFRTTTGPLANYRADQVRTATGTQQSAGPYAALPNHTPPTASVNNHPQQQQPTAAATLGAPSNNLPTIHSMGSFISSVAGSPGTDSNENDLAFLIQRIQNGQFTLHNFVFKIFKICQNCNQLSIKEAPVRQQISLIFA